ncbi:MAG: 3-hydroxyacyl-CoA dehydrogenase family protein [Proteobacteria bacterium]|nr:3-hydroxyacyl-CoA dehydrogenase family protein [Pseudomonadota bacterium]MBU1585538.1 3-hydroxyacyl-CoA dehydrogenase family protein [Pseudomonadota bacterium]MBU2630044.1 3-hydroxyacyl-CoA dehydrogenase family protein [Pseudomonadota bacterium]
MKLEDIKKITVLGSGVMGHGIAQGFAMGGYPVILYDIDEAVLSVAHSHIKESLDLFYESGIYSLDETVSMLAGITTTTDLKAAVEDSDFVIEVIPEILSLKQTVLQQVESCCRKETIIASNTSHLKVSDVFAVLKDQTRVVGAHYFNPPQICPTVEVVKGRHTSDQTLQTTYDLMKKIGKDPVKLHKDVVGLVVNRLQTALLREAFYLHEQGVISAVDIDKAVKGSLGFRAASIGPMTMVDMGGLDAWLDCCEKLLPIMDASVKAPTALKDLVDAGHTGIKSGKGFYEYAKDFSQKGLDEAVKKRDREFLGRLKRNFLSPKR